MQTFVAWSLCYRPQQRRALVPWKRVNPTGKHCATPFIGRNRAQWPGCQRMLVLKRSGLLDQDYLVVKRSLQYALQIRALYNYLQQKQSWVWDQLSLLVWLEHTFGISFRIAFAFAFAFALLARLAGTSETFYFATFSALTFWGVAGSVVKLLCSWPLIWSVSATLVFCNKQHPILVITKLSKYSQAKELALYKQYVQLKQLVIIPELCWWTNCCLDCCLE